MLGTPGSVGPNRPTPVQFAEDMPQESKTVGVTILSLLKFITVSYIHLVESLGSHKKEKKTAIRRATKADPLTNKLEQIPCFLCI